MAQEITINLTARYLILCLKSDVGDTDSNFYSPMTDTIALARDS